MKELENKEVGQIRLEFTDGSWFILDNQKLKHIDYDTKIELDFILSKIYDTIEKRRKEAEKLESNFDLGINTSEDVGTKDVGPGQK